MTVGMVSEYNAEAVIYDGFDEAIIGMAERVNLGLVVAYDINIIVNILMERDGMSYEDAYEYFSFNIINTWVGDFTPIFIHKGDDW